MSTTSLIVLTNDDGVEAPGLEALVAATSHLRDRRIFAPLRPQSGCGHVVTTDRPIATADRTEIVSSVDGTPADCVRIALHRHPSQIAWVLSGINAGGNLGADLHHSGTVAAVREAAIHGIPGIAISHYIARGRSVDWEQAALWTTMVLQELMARPPEAGTFWNVNLPHPEPGGPIPSVVYCRADPSPMSVAYRETADGLVYAASYQTRPRLPSHDIDLCFGGRIAISKVEVLSSSGQVDLG